MNRKEILDLARSEMDKHGLVRWSVKFIQSKSVAGLCWTGYWNQNPRLSFGRIELSSDFFDIFSDYDIIDTIRHEIAHALTKDEYIVIQSGARKGHRRRVIHGKSWKATAKRIGCSGRRCVRKEAEQPKGRYKGICPGGHEIFRQRLTWTAKHNTSCSECHPKFNRDFMFDWYDEGSLVHSQTLVKILQEVK
jgi:predicted SprT family Zn-dependent metalloprotease